MPGILEQPTPYLAFILWHVGAGFLGVHALNRLRFGRSSNLMLSRAASSRNRQIHQVVGLASVLWSVSIVAYVLSPDFRAHALGAPRITIAPWIGWAIAVPSHVGVLMGQLGMGPSFRIGQDGLGEQQATLVKGGLHARSRNPIYLCSIAFLVAEWTWNPSLLCGLTVIAHGIGFHLIVLEEERFLEARFGEPYRRYLGTVPRYLGLTRRS